MDTLASQMSVVPFIFFVRNEGYEVSWVSSRIALSARFWISLGRDLKSLAKDSVRETLNGVLGFGEL